MSNKSPLTMSLTGIANFLGALGIIGSLIFVGIELRQNQQIAKVAAYQALVEQIADFNVVLLTSPEVSRIRIAALNNEKLTNFEQDQYTAYLRMLQRQSELAFVQYQAGIIGEELLTRTLGPFRSHIRTSALSRSLWEDNLRYITTLFDSRPEFEAHINSLVDGPIANSTNTLS
ncbi:MAG: hypothetical protein P8J52_10700 [Gammaproteobacteria bacterium]|nr:hypothetical protein [Gammaproteobacteria bacterium]